MHPLLKPIKRYGIYLSAWSPLAGILIYLMAVPGKLGWRDAVVLIVPLCLVYQFVCLSAWYMCKAATLQRTPIMRTRLTHIVAAEIISLLRVQIAGLLANGLANYPTFRGLDQMYIIQTTVLS